MLALKILINITKATILANLNMFRLMLLKLCFYIYLLEIVSIRWIEGQL